MNKLIVNNNFGHLNIDVSSFPAGGVIVVNNNFGTINVSTHEPLEPVSFNNEVINSSYIEAQTSSSLYAVEEYKTYTSSCSFTNTIKLVYRIYLKKEKCKLNLQIEIEVMIKLLEQMRNSHIQFLMERPY